MDRPLNVIDVAGGLLLKTNYNLLRDQTEAELERLEKLAIQLDTSFKIPFTRFRVGLDSIIGLVPGVGDVGTGCVSSWIVYNGWRLGASKPTVIHMLWNLGLDVLIGSVLLMGDIFDVAWKANLRNVILLRRNLYKQGRANESSRIPVNNTVFTKYTP
jgi:hypothetical protein